MSRGVLQGSILSPFLFNLYVNYKLHCKEVNDESASKAIMKTRPCVARFYLIGQQ